MRILCFIVGWKNSKCWKNAIKKTFFSSLKKITEGDGFVRDGKHVQHVCDSSIKILNFIWYFPQQRRSQKIYFVNQATHAHIWTFFSCSLNWNFVIFWGQFLWFFSFYFRFFFCVIDRIRMRITKWKQWREINCDWSDGFRVLEVTI